MPVSVRHRCRIQQELVTILRTHRHRVRLNVVILPQCHPLRISGELGLIKRILIRRVQPGVSAQTLPHRRLVPLIILNVFQRSHNSLSNPLNIIHARCFRINKNIEWGHPLHERLILNDNRLCRRQIRRNILIGRQITYHLRHIYSGTVSLINGLPIQLVTFHIAYGTLLLHELPTDLQPAVTENKEILNGTTERPPVIVMPPHVIRDRFNKRSPISIIRMRGLNHNLRMIHRNRRCNHINRTESQID